MHQFGHPAREILPEIGDDAAHELASQVLANSFDCIKILDRAGRLLWMNDNGLLLMEVCDLAPLVGSSWVDFWPMPHRQLAERALEAAMAGEVGRFRGMCPTCAGTPRWWDVIVTGIRGEDGAIGRFLSISRDITDFMAACQEREAALERERAARRAAEETRRALERVLLHVSHELRGPLNAVRGWAILLQMGKGSQVECPVAHDAIMQNSERLSVLLDQLFDAARFGAGARINAVPHAIRRIVQDAVDTVTPAARAKRITITVEHLTSASALADFEAIHQVVSNVLFNAVKFTGEGGAVHIRSTLDGEEIQVEVTDTGIGIGEDFIPRLFKPFEQATGTTDRTGLGLGLSIVDALMRAHGGSVHAESPGPGRGSTFTLRMPAAHV